ncbi:MAG: aminotransferase class V-fold PLP-dependent enzyme [Bacteroidetes bacterium]|nr:aminotransferase class V-fold PLP-dependent enzyme [Bacteroidota bacterium]
MCLNIEISYLDNNSTTPNDQRVLEAMLLFLKGNLAIHSSTHHFGQCINEKVHLFKYA